MWYTTCVAKPRLNLDDGAPPIFAALDTALEENERQVRAHYPERNTASTRITHARFFVAWLKGERDLSGVLGEDEDES